MERKMQFTLPPALPEGCIANILSFTSPLDACRSALVSPTFRSAASSDAVWERFLPADYQDIISKSSLKLSSLDSLSKKDLVFHLCHHPVILNNGSLSFTLDKWTGKKCYMLGARELSIIWGDTHTYWRWLSRPESRFSEVAELKVVCWLDIKGKIDTKTLSTKTTYAAYLVYKFATFRHGFKRSPVNMQVKFEEEEGGVTSIVFLDPPFATREQSQHRENGWMEIKMGEFYNEQGDDGTVVCSLWEVDNFTSKHGLIIEGIELRPKRNL
ncbi:F-box family protein [Theobroma cacao]|uniref:F-box family protein n=1 Tax=Theobroma cacao TaxID=3641 RepID=A0A061EKG3_THECC|nr:F-box family protein [Theobroma cacao]